jgi:2-polyprenyl-6-methoxyphenol hydroxylase-like FAD-dependent oxidoreductase
VVGCDGAHSTVRRQAGIGFEGAAYPQTFLLADLEVDGLEPDAAHAWLAGAGMAFFLPLGEPATWRLLAMRPPDGQIPSDAEVSLAELQAITDNYATDALRLRDPAWMTRFRLHLRRATSYRAGRVFLAGDAAHVHSPAGPGDVLLGDAAGHGGYLPAGGRGGRTLPRVNGTISSSGNRPAGPWA